MKFGWHMPGFGSSMEESAETYVWTGLHLNPSAYKVLFDALMALIAKTWPDQMPERLPMALPAWDDPDAWKDL